MSEAEEQITVVEYCDALGIPIYHIPNERRCSAKTGAHLKAQGLRRGFPDLCVPVPAGDFSALYIELKAEGGKVSAEQEEWIYRLRRYGNLACVCYGAKNAIELIEAYMARRVKLVTSDRK